VRTSFIIAQCPYPSLSISIKLVSLRSFFNYFFYYKSFLTCLVCSTSTILGTIGLNSGDVPLSNKQTNKQERHIHSILPFISEPYLLSLAVSMVLARLVYGGGTLAGLPGRLIDILNSVPNESAWLLLSARKCDHRTPLPRVFHWLCHPKQ